MHVHFLRASRQLSRKSPTDETLPRDIVLMVRLVQTVKCNMEKENYCHILLRGTPPSLLSKAGDKYPTAAKHITIPKIVLFWLNLAMVIEIDFLCAQSQPKAVPKYKSRLRGQSEAEKQSGSITARSM